MSVPIHNLYDYIYQCLEKRYLLYYFFPFGHKDLKNLIAHIDTLDPSFTNYKTTFYKNISKNLIADLQYQDISKIFPKQILNLSLMSQYMTSIICHDQEPLDYNYYNDIETHKNYYNTVYEKQATLWLNDNLNLRWAVDASSPLKQMILIHSELNSAEVEKYNNSGKFICAYFWSHALLSRDWFRFANYDDFLQPGSDVKKTFLIYCRDTTGKRHYRKNFLDLLQQYDLSDYQLGSFDQNNVSSDSSAEYNYNDFNQTSISVVLETCFDDRIHLTEKILRCLACGHPFVLAAGPHSLEYIRSYGFKTFAPYICESYDIETDPSKRLEMIVGELKRYEMLPEKVKIKFNKQMKKIAEYNKKVFFSEEFYNQVVDELKTNVSIAESQLANNYNPDVIWTYLKYEKQNNMLAYRKNPKRPYVLSFLKHLKKGGTLENYVPPWEKI